MLDVSPTRQALLKENNIFCYAKAFGQGHEKARHDNQDLRPRHTFSSKSRPEDFPLTGEVRVARKWLADLMPTVLYRLSKPRLALPSRGQQVMGQCPPFPLLAYYRCTVYDRRSESFPCFTPSFTSLGMRYISGEAA